MSRSMFAIASLTAALGAAMSLPVAGDMPMQHSAPMAPAAATPSAADQKLIDSAMQAAPAKVSASAAIVALEADGSMRTVRAGSNGFTCMADNPATPGPDPMCMDAVAMEWAGAWIGHKPPATGKIGFMYMLSGGTDASNIDPYALAPTADNHWVETGPHVMIVGADPSFYDMYPKSAAPDTSVPYVMWAGTPYQHLMIPIK